MIFKFKIYLFLVNALQSLVIVIRHGRNLVQHMEIRLDPTLQTLSSQKISSCSLFTQKMFVLLSCFYTVKIVCVNCV